MKPITLWACGRTSPSTSSREPARATHRGGAGRCLVAAPGRVQCFPFVHCRNQRRSGVRTRPISDVELSARANSEELPSIRCPLVVRSGECPAAAAGRPLGTGRGSTKRPYGPPPDRATITTAGSPIRAHLAARAANPAKNQAGTSEAHPGCSGWWHGRWSGRPHVTSAVRDTPGPPEVQPLSWQWRRPAASACAARARRQS